MNIFFSRDVHGSQVILDPVESQHCIKVLRQGAGDSITIVDGKGTFMEGIISVPDPKACVVSVSKSEYEYGKRNYHLHVAIAPTKNIERFEWFLEKATEIGVDEITPIICQRSERKILREDRLEKLIISAMKQSVKAYLPVLHPMVAFQKFTSASFPGNRLIAHCIESEKQDLIRIKNTGNRFTILIGPEGDFSETEVEMAVAKGYSPVSLGSSRLRTETAGVVACQVIADLIALQKK